SSHPPSRDSGGLFGPLGDRVDASLELRETGLQMRHLLDLREAQRGDRPRDQVADDLATTGAQIAHDLDGLLGTVARLLETLAGLLDRDDLRGARDQVLGVGPDAVDELLALIPDALDGRANVLERNAACGICHGNCLPLLSLNVLRLRGASSVGCPGGPVKGGPRIS